MSYADLIHDVRILTGGSPARKTPDYYASLAKQYAEKAFKHAVEAEASATAAGASEKTATECATQTQEDRKEVAIMRDACNKYMVKTKEIADSIKDMQIFIITDEDIDAMMKERKWLKNI